MRTIPRKFPGKRTGGVFRDDCVVCGAPWYSNKLIRRPDGLYVCSQPSCSDGREAYELAGLQREAAASVNRQVRSRRGVV